MLEELTQNLFTYEQKITLFFTVIIGLCSSINHKIPINYGKYISSFTNIIIPSQIAWIIFESPNLLWFIYFVFQGKNGQNIYNILTISPFVLHYINRTIIYPLRNPTTKGMPLEIVAFAMSYTFLNGYLQNSYLLDTAEFDSSLLSSFQFYLGILIFGVGFWINVQSDNILLELKFQCQEKQKKGDKVEYMIPQKGFFKYVTQPNYFGEVIEYLGYGIASNSFVGIWFCINTLIILGFKARDNHNWYLKKFPDYPKERKRIIPYIY